MARRRAREHFQRIRLDVYCVRRHQPEGQDSEQVQWVRAFDAKLKRYRVQLPYFTHRRGNRTLVSRVDAISLVWVALELGLPGM